MEAKLNFFFVDYLISFGGGFFLLVCKLVSDLSLLKFNPLSPVVK